MRRRNRERAARSEAGGQAEAFLPEESALDPRSFAAEIRERVTLLEQQLLAQFTSIAAHAMIAQTDVATARDESHAAAERTRAMTIELIDRLRREASEHIRSVERRLTGGPESDAVRVDALERRVAELSADLARSVTEQRRLVEALAALDSERMEREGWLVSGGPGAQLSLR